MPTELANFQKDNLKKVTTVESSALSRDCALQKVASFDQHNLNKVETVEKANLPSKEGRFWSFLKFLKCHLDIAREKVPLDAASFQKENLKPVQTVQGTASGHALSMMVSDLVDKNRQKLKISKIEF